MSEKLKKSSKSIAEYEHEISILKAEIDDLKLKLEYMNEILVNMQRARFGQSSEKQKYVSPGQLSVFRLRTECRSFLRRMSFSSCLRMKEIVLIAASLCVKSVRDSCARSSSLSGNR